MAIEMQTTGSAAWEKPEVRKLDAADAEVAAGGGTDAGVFS
jgi:hypothetical protein